MSITGLRRDVATSSGDGGVQAALAESGSSTPTAATPHAYSTESDPSDNEASSAPTAQAPGLPGIDTDELNAGWFSGLSAWFPTMAWAAAGIAGAIGARWAGRRRRRLVVCAAVAVPLAFVWFFFFENVSRLLPSSI